MTTSGAENVMHKTSSQHDFFKTSLQLPPSVVPKPQMHHQEETKKQKIHSHFRYCFNFFNNVYKKKLVIDGKILSKNQNHIP